MSFSNNTFRVSSLVKVNQWDLQPIEPIHIELFIAHPTFMDLQDHRITSTVFIRLVAHVTHPFISAIDFLHFSRGDPGINQSVGICLPRSRGMWVTKGLGTDKSGESILQPQKMHVFDFPINSSWLSRITGVTTDRWLGRVNRAWVGFVAEAKKNIHVIAIKRG